MTPPTTAAVRPPHRSAPGSRRNAVRHPRRISGAAGPTRSAAAMVAVPAPGIALPRLRPRPQTARRASQGRPGIALRAVDAFESISSSSVLDRLIRGRVWIGLLAFALIGIVAMQLLVLELNTGIGRTLGHVEQLQRQNAQLGIEDSTYSAESRVAPLAAAAGMMLAPAGTVHFVAPSKADVARAAAALSATVQSSASGSSESTGAASSESGSAQTAGTEAPAGAEASSRGSAATAETSGSSEAGGSTEGAGASSESSSAGSGQGSSASGSSSSAAATSPPTSTPSAVGAQATGASAAPSSGSASSTEAGGSGGNPQAGSRE